MGAGSSALFSAAKQHYKELKIHQGKYLNVTSMSAVPVAAAHILFHHQQGEMAWMVTGGRGSFCKIRRFLIPCGNETFACVSATIPAQLLRNVEWEGWKRP